MDVARSMPSNRIVGDPDHVAGRLQELAGRTGADEIMISTMTYGLAERLTTLDILADIWARCDASTVV
jgi:alkanesulfonate monooxygenase SsuD/methylene tetrahydromethanopterin reductase-like flavin-dependent oxidoreductase (luciferase family)